MVRTESKDMTNKKAKLSIKSFGKIKSTKKILKSKLMEKTNRIKPHQIECERLKEIIPTVANQENVNEIQIIKEAIKHIDQLEQAVIQRLGISTSLNYLQNGLPNPLLMRLLHQNAVRNMVDNIYHTSIPTTSERGIQMNFGNHYSIQNLTSTGTTPCHTDDDDYL